MKLLRPRESAASPAFVDLYVGPIVRGLQRSHARSGPRPGPQALDLPGPCLARQASPCSQVSAPAGARSSPGSRGRSRRPAVGAGDRRHRAARAARRILPGRADVLAAAGEHVDDGQAREHQVGLRRQARGRGRRRAARACCDRAGHLLAGIGPRFVLARLAKTSSRASRRPRSRRERQRHASASTAAEP